MNGDDSSPSGEDAHSAAGSIHYRVEVLQTTTAMTAMGWVLDATAMNMHESISSVMTSQETRHGVATEVYYMSPQYFTNCTDLTSPY